MLRTVLALALAAVEFAGLSYRAVADITEPTPMPRDNCDPIYYRLPKSWECLAFRRSLIAKLVTLSETGFVAVTTRAGQPDVVESNHPQMRGRVLYNKAHLENVNTSYEKIIIPIQFGPNAIWPLVFGFKNNAIQFQGLRVGEPH